MQCSPPNPRPREGASCACGLCLPTSMLYAGRKSSTQGTACTLSLQTKALPAHLSHAHAASSGSRLSAMALSFSCLLERSKSLLFTYRPGLLPAPISPCNICSRKQSRLSPHKVLPAESAKQARRVAAQAHSVCWGVGGPLEMAALLQVSHGPRCTACPSAAADASKASVHACSHGKPTLTKVCQPAGQGG